MNDARRPSATVAVPSTQPACARRSRSAISISTTATSQALKGINLPLYDRKVTAFIGPSGCGKSTLLRVLNRMYDLYPDQRAEGEVLLDGENILSPQAGPQPAARARRHGVPEADAVPDVDLRQHRLRHPALRDARQAELDDRVEEALRRAALWDEVKDKLQPSGLSLSGGQQQRLCIARTIAVQPEVMLLDEPCSALDPISTAKIEELIDELKGDYTIVIVTHNMQQAARVSRLHRLHVSRRAGRVRRDRARSSPRRATSARRTTSPAASADADDQGSQPWPSTPSAPTTRSCSDLEPQDRRDGRPRRAAWSPTPIARARRGATRASAQQRRSPPTRASTRCSARSRSRRS